MSYTLWLLSRRAYTVAQLRDKLQGKHTDPAVIERVLARLEELALVDDRAYAHGFVRSRRKRKGRLALRRELQHKGVGEDDIAAALDPLDHAAQLQTAEALLHKHRWRFAKDDPRKNRAKAFAFLARRGFPAEVAGAALERALDDPDDA